MGYPDISNKLNTLDYYVDLTPDKDLPLRILRCYRARCNEKWDVSGVSDGTIQIYDAMNADQDKRAVILNMAIKILEESMK